MYKSALSRSIHGTDMSLHWSLDEQAVRVTVVVVIVNVVRNRRDEIAPACKDVPVGALSFENAPEALHELLLGDDDEVERWLEEGRIECGFLRLPPPPGRQGTAKPPAGLRLPGAVCCFTAWGTPCSTLRSP